MIVTMMLLLAVNIDYVAAKEGKDSSEPTRIEIEKKDFTNSEVERSIDNSIIEAVLYATDKQVEVTLYNIGEADVYVVNSRNQVISNANAHTDSPTIVNLNVLSGQVVCYIIVMSEKWYAEGKFTL